MGHPRVDKYHILKSIGKGGMGEVYLAINPGVGGMGKFVALKKIRREYTLDRKRTKLFRREAQVAVKLNHPNICAIYEVGEHDGGLYLVMEYLPGVDLRRIFEYHCEGAISLDVPDIIHIGISVAAGLAYAHDFIDPKTGNSSPVIHCDLCPHNIRVNYEGAIKLIDFGVAKVIGGDANTQTDPVMGKVEYISPEHGEGATLNARSDIYSLGIVLWEMLSKKRYYKGDGLNAIRAHLMGEQAPKNLPTELPNQPALQAIINRMLSHDPDNRYKSAEELEAELRRFSNKNYPDYVPNSFRDAVQVAYSDEIIAHQKVISEFVDSVEAQPQLSPADSVQPARILTQPRTNEIGNSKTKPTAESLFEAVQILNAAKEKKEKKEGSLLLPALLLVLIASAFVFKHPDVQDFLSEMSAQEEIAESNPPQDQGEGPVGAPEQRRPSSKTQGPAPDPDSRANAEAKGTEKPIRSKKAKEYTRIHIDSVPSGADILLNGRKAYRRTPTYLPVEPGKSYLIKLRKKGYKAHEAYFDPEDGPVKIRLKKRRK
ncbi:MAG: serine/threonine protein kinase [Bdellovibrionaceae bacterium]|nr:serine/threonine protein kinase [Bdellovibrionales bacterium]MCB9083215.1 serine/threonine protein kinase [Pseudobdellovibrionaceae bacterium]